MTGAIIHAVIVTMDPERKVLKDAGILWQNGRITLIDSSDKVKEEAQAAGAEVTDAHGAYVFPGMINTHNHLFQHLLKGIGTDMNLEDWWPSTIGPAGQQIREQHVRAAVRGGVMEALRTGTTTIVDYFQVHPVAGLSEAEIETARETGIRLMYGRGFRDYQKANAFGAKGLAEGMSKILTDIGDLNSRYTDEKEHMVRVYLAPASAPACSFEGMQETAKFSLSENIPVTMHVFETNVDEVVTKERYNKKLIEYLEDSGLLDTEFLAVHCVQMKEEDIDRFCAHNITISHNPLSNLYLASGVAPVPEFLKRGLTVSLGTDGAASNNSNNMLEVLKSTALMHKLHSNDPLAMTAPMVLEMATIGGARAIGMEKELGSLEIGKRADLFVFDPMRASTCSPSHDPISTLVYSSDSRGIVMTVVNGNILLAEDRFTKIDEAAAVLEEQRQAEDLARRAGLIR